MKLSFHKQVCDSVPNSKFTMPEFIRKRLLHCANRFALNYNSPVSITPFLGFNPFSSASTNTVESNSNNANESFVVTYLINTFGFSHSSALKASKLLYFKSPERPDAVIALFKSFGLNDAQIYSIVSKRPMLLQFRNDNLLPKIEFLQSLGFSSSDMPKILASGKDILGTNLNTQIIPCFDFLKSFFSTNEDLMYCIRLYPSILSIDYRSSLAANIETLRDVGLPERNIIYMVRRNPRVMLVQPLTFGEAVAKVLDIGFNPLRTSFVKGIWAIRNSKLGWEEKMEVYKRWGLSEDEVLATFRTYPWCMITSADKITRVFEFFVNEMGCSSSIVMRAPPLVSLSLEKTIVPRCAVYRVLQSKGLMKKDIGLTKLLMCTKKMFLKKYVEIYEEEAPELLKLYQEKSGLSNQVDYNFE